MRTQKRAVSMNFKPASNRVEYTPVGVVGRRVPVELSDLF